MTWPQFLGYLASGLVLLTFAMRTMAPMRVAAIASNLAFIAYGLSLGLTPVWLLHGILLPLNAWRLLEQRPRRRRRGERRSGAAAARPDAARRRAGQAAGLPAVLPADERQDRRVC